MINEPTETTEKVNQPLPEETGSAGAKLLVVVGREIGKEFPLGTDDTVLGRNKDADVVVLDGKVSRRHTLVRRLPAESGTGFEFQAVDLDSTNGTFVNNRRITRKFLRNGDKLVVGDTTFQFLVQGVNETVSSNQLYRMAITDSLTGLLNREFFYQELTKEFLRAKRYKRDLSLAIIDVDHFKAINDKLGHHTGDLALRELSFIIMDMTRRQDSAARYGGEEFALILPETKIEEGFDVCEKIRAFIDQYEFGLANGLKVTVSAGIAAYVPTLQRVDELILNTEMALFHAKRSGRNCTVKASDEIIGEAKGFISAKTTTI